MNLSSAKAKLSLAATAATTSTNVTGSARIGPSDRAITFPASDVIYTLQAVVTDGATFNLTPLTGVTSDSDVWTAGNAQVETATAAGTITLAGNATVTVTAAGLTGSPLAITFAVALSDTPTLWAVKARAALAANAAVAAMFTVSGATTAIILTRKPDATFTVGTTTINTYAANDVSLNVALADDTSTGITEATTSADTTAGVATAGCYIFDGDAKDFEGIAIPTMDLIQGIIIDSEANTGAYAEIVQAGESTLPTSIPSGGHVAHFHTTGIPAAAFALTPDGADTLITLTVIGTAA